MIDLTEEDIVANWHDLDKPLVSVQCITFNHVAYIAQALDSFLTQRTNFPFEIIVHDDVSVDGTVDVIREYERRFPQIVKPIYEKENQYSKKDGSLEKIINSACKGRYIAFCEGDDYWTDNGKLQKQFDFLESHPDYAACAHNTFVIEVEGKKKNHLMYPLKDVVLTIENLKDRYHASSLMFRHSFSCWPTFMNKSLAPGDVKLAAYLKYNGAVFRFGDVMSAYRHGTPGSWTKTQLKSKDDFSNIRSVILFYEDFNKWSNFKYTSISYRLDQLNLDLMLKQGLFFEAKCKYPKLFSELNIKQKIRYFLVALKKRMG